MKHIKQDDPRCIEPMRTIGCFVRSCGLIAEYKTGRDLTARQINELWTWGKSAKRINEQDEVTDSESIATRALRELGDAGRFVEVGKFENGIITWKPAYKGTPICRFDAGIQKIRQGGPHGTHFIVVDRYGNLIEDPYSHNIKSQGIIYTRIYAYIPQGANV